MSSINSNIAAGVAGSSLQAKEAARDREKKANLRRELRDVVLDLSSTLQADNDKSEQELIDQELPDQGPPLPPEYLQRSAEGENQADETMTPTTQAYGPNPVPRSSFDVEA